MMIWGCMNTGYPMKRSPPPAENDMTVHYAVAEGAKGIYYFCDWNSYPQVYEGGYFIGMRKTNMLWKNIALRFAIARFGFLTQCFQIVCRASTRRNRQHDQQCSNERNYMHRFAPRCFHHSAPAAFSFSIPSEISRAIASPFSSSEGVSFGLILSQFLRALSWPDAAATLY